MRIGVFYDGSYFTYARNYFYHERELAGSSSGPYKHCLRRSSEVENKDTIIIELWYFCLVPRECSVRVKAEPRQLKNERNLLHDLMHAGIEPKYMPMPLAGGGEKALMLHWRLTRCR